MRNFITAILYFLAIVGTHAAPIRDSIVAHVKAGDVRRAWLENETQRYAHFVLGGQWEAETLVTRDAEGKEFRFDLPADAVFEDREVRIADLDGDGRNEIVTVISRQSVGSSLGVFGVRDGKLVLLAETPPNGQPNRWLNPSGIGHFTGATTLEIAIVRMPHLIGRLELWSFDGRNLTRRFARDGYSTHRIGSRHQRLFSVVRIPSGKNDLLILPSLDRRSLHVMDFTAPERSPPVYTLKGETDGAFRNVAQQGRSITLAVPLAGGEVQRVMISIGR
ncbi:MAG: hypothetical protein ACRCYS_05925 [Beijerinckiaceae bacterium]